MKRLFALLALTVCAAAALAAPPADIAADIQAIQARWATIRYTLPEDARAEALEALAEDAHALSAAHPQSADALIWEGIVLSTWAGAEGGLGALKRVKLARASLEQALAVDPTALDGSAYASLGALYAQVPGWPVSFGDAEEAERLLKAALAINPDGIDSNYFWADFLYREGRYDEAKAALARARSAAPRPGRELADQGRRGEIDELLRKVDAAG